MVMVRRWWSTAVVRSAEAGISVPLSSTKSVLAVVASMEAIVPMAEPSGTVGALGVPAWEASDVVGAARSV